MLSRVKPGTSTITRFGKFTHNPLKKPFFSREALVLLLLRSSPTLTLPLLRQLHALLLVHGSSHVPHSQLLRAYVGNGAVRDALHVFDHMPRRSTFAYNSIIKGFVDLGRSSDALCFYNDMIREGFKADNFTYPLVLKACTGVSDIDRGREIHKCVEFEGVFSSNVFVRCALVDMYAKCGSLVAAREVFNEMPVRDLATWGAMICGTMQGGDWSEGLVLFRRMRSEGFGIDSAILATVIPACGRLGAPGLGMALHGLVVKFGVIGDLCVANALIDMYCKCGDTQIADRLFRTMEFKDVISWSSLIAGYLQNNEFAKSLGLFVEKMESGLTPNSVVIASIMPSVSELKLFKLGKEIHGYAVRRGHERDRFVASAVIGFYCKNGLMREAESIFRTVSDGDIAIGNSMITGYALQGDLDSATTTLRRIQEMGFRPDSVTIVSVLPLCNRFTMIDQGKELHAYATRAEFGSVVSVNNSLMDMYCKCGFVEFAKKIFDTMTERNTVTYNIVITALGMHGRGEEGIEFFDHMKEQSIEPDKVEHSTLGSTNPDMVKEVLSNKCGYYTKNDPNPHLQALLGKGLILINGQDWAHHRTAFTIDKLMLSSYSKNLQKWELERKVRNMLMQIIQARFESKECGC
ncbi:Pentatricopeptide repeat-containing protein, chloroplastic [Ananas comosus]|uniref:Pentatricopeptide repeat-containing protein, chloroplastic n=1 Tax=Ananas comosus TaxID=4615 RepID=A0A199UDJ6_ANACO|nr:Pentatricopeptide repeat-containing protein, chloroplastic [Ananas comosus]